jgi:prepilin-type N-terminal cleavage/methylation domain-containing protein
MCVNNTHSVSKGFTIVELLLVIVVIGILAAITIVSYTGVSKKATIASQQSDLTSASRQLEMYKTDNGYYLHRSILTNAL